MHQTPFLYLYMIKDYITFSRTTETKTNKQINKTPQKALTKSEINFTTCKM